MQGRRNWMHKGLHPEEKKVMRSMHERYKKNVQKRWQYVKDARRVWSQAKAREPKLGSHPNVALLEW